LLFLEHSAALPDEEEDPTKDFHNRNPGPGPRSKNNNENNPAPRKGKVKTDGKNIVEKTSEEKTFRNILLLFMNVWD